MAVYHYHTCVECNKRAYTSRKDAKQARKQTHPGDGQALHPYECPYHPGTFHIGRMYHFNTREQARRHSKRKNA